MFCFHLGEGNMIYLKENDASDINRIDEYNKEYLSIYPDFKPFATRENFASFLKKVEDKKMVFIIMD